MTVGGYSKEFLAGWGTMDFNGHMANTAYLLVEPDLAEIFELVLLHHETDLRARKLVAPPEALLAAFADVPRAPGFVELPPKSVASP